MSYAKEVILGKALAFKHQGTDTADAVINYVSDDMDESVQLKNVCAKLTPQLVNDIENVCGILDISKRRFIELAVIDLLANYQEIAGEYDIFAPHEIEKESK